MKNKKVWLAVICVIILIAVLCGIYFMMNRIPKTNVEIQPNNSVNSNSNVNTENKVAHSNKMLLGDNSGETVLKIGEFEISNISLKYEDEMTDFSANIQNNSENDYEDGVQLNISFYRADDSLMYELPVMTGTLLKGGRSSISARTTKDITDAAKISVSKVD